MNRTWTDKEEQYLIANYATTSNTDLAKKLGKKCPLHERFLEWLRFLPMRAYYKVRPQCPKKHSPYAHLSDEFVEKNAFWLAGASSKSKTYGCMKRKYHFGKCEDCSGRQWNGKEPYKVFVPTNKL